jgi:hypothetical protein
MAQHEITRSCGHVETVQIYGKGGINGWRHDWVATREITRPCRACRQAETTSVRAADSAAYAEAAADAGLPALTGTDRQGAWAETLRGDTLNLLADFTAELRAHGRAYPDQQWGIERVIAHIGVAIAEKTAAAWWIDNQDAHNLAQLIKREAADAHRPEHEAMQAETASAAALAAARVDATPLDDQPEGGPIHSDDQQVAP